ncbi:hypothetical protein Acr_06g0008210 [Actinidia rufa]|uniref:Uncharacterized protein n=1 Tax=Actinidia rufa TaxID=165716 RepID=A0A7J0EQW5_9ERIC|nr:hypothetical protein Acr_06g0008210 [Actinidia rufa]
MFQHFCITSLSIATRSRTTLPGLAKLPFLPFVFVTELSVQALKIIPLINMSMKGLLILLIKVGEEVKQEVEEEKVKEEVSSTTSPSTLAAAPELGALDLSSKEIEVSVTVADIVWEHDTCLALTHAIMLPQDVANLHMEDRVTTCNVTIMQHVQAFQRLMATSSERNSDGLKESQEPRGEEEYASRLVQEDEDTTDGRGEVAEVSTTE